MKTSETTSEISGALATAQEAFPTIPKERTADMEKFTYNYADLSDVVEAIRKPLAASGLSVVQTPEVVVMETTAADGAPVRVLADVMTTRILHQSGEWIEGSMKIQPLGGAQAQGSGITYARRYHLCAMLGLVSDNDDDGALAQAAYGELNDSRSSRSRRAPKGSTSTRSTGGRRDPETAGKTSMAARDRNKIPAYFNKLTPPVRDPEAILAKVNAILGPDGPVEALVKLTDVQGAKVIQTLGIT